MREFIIETKFKVYAWEELTSLQRELITQAKQMVHQSYSPYSHFAVGAAVRLAGGVIVRGSNQENAAYPSGICAERNTLFSANANYPDLPVEALAIACYTHGAFTAEAGAPCGACRQVMIETEHRYNHPMEILLYGENGTYVLESANQLLPLGFFAENLHG